MSSAVPILLYHSITDDVESRFRQWAVHPEVFAAHIRFLREHEYTPLTVSQLVQATSDDSISLPGRPVVVTFDDGFADFHANALPVLMRHDFVATLYITVGFIGDTSRWLHDQGEGERPMLTWGQIAEISAEGVECGAHSLTHPQLDVMATEAARDEVIRPKMVLEERLGHEIATFAYPYGHYIPAVREMVRQAGYSSACAVKHAMSSTTDDRFALARIMVHSQTDVGRLRALLSGQGLRVAPARERMQTKVWRLIRRLNL